jgi:adenylosuccinate synthase
MNQATIIVDLGFGDSGKGSMTDYYVRRTGAKTVIRYNGGAQAAHNVVGEDGRSHVFAQFGSGTLVPGVETYLSKHMLIDPYALYNENNHLRSLGITDALARLIIDPDAIIITPFHQAMNRLRELQRGNARHGSCGMGIGETMADSIAMPDLTVRARDIYEVNKDGLIEKLQAIRDHKLTELAIGFSDVSDTEEFDRISQPMRDPSFAFDIANTYLQMKRDVVVASMLPYFLSRGNTVFEGAQGVLLDEWHGFHPYTTWSTTTAENAESLIGSSRTGVEINTVGVIRAYSTRHGPGPFPTYDRELTALLPDTTNGTGRWQGSFNVGWLDLPLVKYAIDCTAIDELAMTCVDRVVDLATQGKLKVCTGYSNTPDPEPVFDQDLDYQEQLGDRLSIAKPLYKFVDVPGLIETAESFLNKSIATLSFGPTAADKMNAKHYKTKLVHETV